jgi:phosphoribosylformylglycinamidine synthase
VEGKRIAIPGTLLISAVSVLDNWQVVISANLKKEGNLIYILGFTKPQLGASQYFRNLKIKGGTVPKIDKKIAKKIFEKLSEAIEKRLVISCHDLSEGGLAVAVAEMCIGANRGANIFLSDVPRQPDMLNYEVLFSESPTRFLLEVEKAKKDIFERQLKGLPLGLIGCVSGEKRLAIYGKDGQEAIDLTLEELKESWTETFAEFR